MSALEQQIKLLRTEQLLSQSAEKHHEDIEDCKHIYDRFQVIAGSLKAMVANIAVLQELPEDAPESMQFSAEIQEQCSKASACLKIFVGIWQQKKSSALQDDALDDAHAALRELATQLEEKVEFCWSAWTGQLENSCRVEQVALDTQRGIPGVEQFYTEYVALRKKFLEQTKQLPPNVWAIQGVEKLAASMRQVRDQMVFDLPADVIRFFNKLNQLGSQGRAPLSMMTLEAFQWLKENDQLEQYTVSRKTY